MKSTDGRLFEINVGFLALLDEVGEVALFMPALAAWSQERLFNLGLPQCIKLQAFAGDCTSLQITDQVGP